MALGTDCFRVRRAREQVNGPGILELHRGRVEGMRHSRLSCSLVSTRIRAADGGIATHLGHAAGISPFARWVVT